MQDTSEKGLQSGFWIAKNVHQSEEMFISLECPRMATITVTYVGTLYAR